MRLPPDFRRRGLASSAASKLVAAAFASGEVDWVIAYTLPADPASAGVLKASGFAQAGTLIDREQGETWQWVRHHLAESP